MRFETEQHWLFTENQNFGLVYGLSGKEFYQLELWIIFNFIFFRMTSLLISILKRTDFLFFRSEWLSPKLNPNLDIFTVYKESFVLIQFWKHYHKTITVVRLSLRLAMFWEIRLRYVYVTFTLRYESLLFHICWFLW